jgi:ABC-type sugar transport system ATPase subunit
VLRDGKLVDACDRPDFDRVRLMSSMVGRSMSVIPRRTTSSSTTTPVLEVDRLAHADIFEDVSFTLHAGEILGLAGLIGAGRTEIAETIFGIRAPRAGRVTLAGHDITGRSPHQVMGAGLAYVPEDRARHGAILPMTIAENVSAASLDRLRRVFGLISRSDENERARAEVERLRVRSTSVGQRLRELSGGNQQKVVFGKWMSLGPAVAILDEPTRGVDVGAKEEIYALIEQLARDGIAILVISSEMEELVRLSDRVVSIYEGRVVAVLDAERITPELVGRSYLSAEGLPA